LGVPDGGAGLRDRVSHHYDMRAHDVLDGPPDVGAGWSIKTQILLVRVGTGLLLIVWRAACDPRDPGTLTRSNGDGQFHIRKCPGAYH